MLRRLRKFVVVGVYNTAVGYAIFVVVALVVRERLHHQAILAIAFTLAVIHSYAMQRILVFESTNAIRAEFPKFVAVNLSALALNALLLELLVRVGVPLLAAQLVATLATTLVTFVAHQAWSFRASR